MINNDLALWSGWDLAVLTLEIWRQIKIEGFSGAWLL